MKPQNQKPEIIEVNTYKGCKLININLILYLKADNKHTKIVFKNTEELETNHMLKWYENTLDEDRFVRCHRSFIVNIDFIESINGKWVLLKKNITVPVARGKNEVCKSKLASFILNNEKMI